MRAPGSPRTDGLTSIVMVAADSGPLLARSVDAALASDAPIELILLDNASTDGAFDAVAADRAGDPRVRFVRNESNIGFGPACNRGARLANGDVLLFLNPDCELRRDTIAGLRVVLAGNHDIGIAGVNVLDADGCPARGNRRRDPTLRRAVMAMTGLSRFERRWPALAGVEMPPCGNASEVEDVEAVSGACLAMPRAVFVSVGGFDEGYFLHVEDLDLCRRVRDAGFRVVFVPYLDVTHAQGGSSRHRALFVERHKQDGMWRYFMRFDPAARNRLVRVAVRAALAMRGVLLRLRLH